MGQVEGSGWLFASGDGGGYLIAGAVGLIVVIAVIACLVWLIDRISGDVQAQRKSREQARRAAEQAARDKDL